MKIAQRAHELIWLSPEAPFAVRAATQEQRPGTARGNVEIVALVASGSPDGGSGYCVPTGGSDVGVASSQNDGDEVERMVMKEALVV